MNTSTKDKITYIFPLILAVLIPFLVYYTNKNKYRNFNESYEQLYSKEFNSVITDNVFLIHGDHATRYNLVELDGMFYSILLGSYGDSIYLKSAEKYTVKKDRDSNLMVFISEDNVSRTIIIEPIQILGKIDIYFILLGVSVALSVAFINYKFSKGLYKLPPKKR